MYVPAWRKGKSTAEMPVFIYGQALTAVDNVKILGITVSNNLS